MAATHAISSLMYFAACIPDWNSLDSVRRAHSRFELWSIILFGFLALAEAIAHKCKDEKKKDRWDTSGIVFFILAIACEGIAYPYGQRNDILSEATIESLDQKAERAKDAADTALTNSTMANGKAETANTEALEAKRNAEKAGRLATGARTGADRAKVTADSVARTAAELSKDLLRNGPRINLLYGKKQKEFVGKMTPFAGQKATIEYCSWDIPSAPFGTDRELITLVLQFNGLLKFNAHWNVSNPTGSRQACSGNGIWVGTDLEASPETKRAARALIDELLKLGLSANVVQLDPNTRSATDTVTLIVQPHL